jgi:signal transduction histidine kinase
MLSKFIPIVQMISGESTTSQDHSPSRWQSRARTAWYVAAVLTLAVVILAIPGYIRAMPKGFSVFEFAANPSPVVLAINVLTALISFATAILSLYLAFLLFHRWPDDRMALFLSFYLLVFGIYSGPFDMLVVKEPFSLISKVWNSIFTPLIIYPASCILFLLFPDGRFAPDWSRRLALAALVTAPVGTIANLIWFRSQPGAVAPIVISSILMVVVVSGVLYAQFYRYRHIASRQQRQQIKWVVYGLGIMLFLLVATALPYFWSFTLPANTPYPLWLAITTAIYYLSFAVFPVSLTIAVMRYRLYDIDILINRTLVYGALTGCVVALYVLVVGAFGVLLETAGNLIVALVATGLVAVLFQPLRARLQKTVNRMMYGERDEPFTVLRRLGQRLESSGVPEDILSAIVETITQVLKLPYAEITLLHGEKFECAAQYGAKVDEVFPFPIQYQGQIIGYLNVTSRGMGESFGEADEGLLRQIARQAGPVAQAVQLTRDLRQSRARLVTAREEERRRLRRDLHDGLGPVLASQGLKIAAVSHLLDADPQRARKFLDELASQNEATVAEIRRLVYALRPPELDELGLVGAVRDYVAGLNGSSAGERHLQVIIQMPGGKLPELPAAIEVAAYRIATEALTNVTWHAMAHYCTVSFTLEENGSSKILQLRIVDDGIGFSKRLKAGVGLNSMRERAEEVSGTFTIDSAHQTGTRVVARLPLAI